MSDELVQRTREHFADQARRAALWDAVGEPAVKLLREVEAFEDEHVRLPLLRRISALLASAEQQP